ncbi:hypothetical protein [Rubripirellula reticaptiva]|uniref:Peptidase family M50 n=1 Tax=Rubripirellula reticaptiva TaxID=2528013 RepID=A0A5C6F801_9BACT|nr:hypothetical protein [Rubripirellula reticaptiva]TWU56226.1 Peptidase family M50 [Rubripirellula reticaptiva]
MTSHPTTVRLRADLIHRQIRSGGQKIWVVKDPLVRSYFHFTDQEHAMLMLADGRRSFKQLSADAASLFLPLHLSPQQVLQFFAGASHNGLVATRNTSTPSLAKRSRRWSNPLAIRLPGIDPTQGLAKLDFVSRLLFSVPAMTVIATLVIAAVLTVITRWSSFASDVATAASRLDNWIILALVIGTTKITHELAHAMACQKLGARCSEIGVMFLVGVPCLYCDVSDAWMLDRPWKRILVSAAGMIAELSIAAVATVAWVAANDGPLRDICVTVMVVCSVSTLLFNGNPLMKYDGYYILSDVIGMPNLASRARTAFQRRFTNTIWGAPSNSGSGSIHDPAHYEIGLIGFAIASGIYRTLVYSVIAMTFYQWAKLHGFADTVFAVGLAAGSFAVGRRIYHLLTQPKHARSPHGRSQIRVGTATGIAAALTVIAVTFPLPRSVTAVSITEPQSAKSIVVSAPGQIRHAVLSGATVRPNDIVASLIDDDADRERIAIATHRDQLESELAGLQNRRGVDAGASAAIPMTRKSLDQTNKQLSLIDRELDRRTLRSDVNGVAFPPERITESQTPDWQPRGWKGTPLDVSNRGAQLDEGTQVCVIGDAVRRDAIVYLSQNDVELVRIGQQAILRVADRPRGSVTGHITEIATSPANEIPASLIQSGRIQQSSVDSQPQPYYQARIRIDHQPITLPVRMIAAAQIKVDSASFWTRLNRWASDAF